MALVPDDHVELGRRASTREALLGADFLPRCLTDLEQLPEAVVVDDHDRLAAVPHRLNRASPVGHDGERAYDEHRAQLGAVEDRFPRGDRLAEADVVGEQESWTAR